jgi:hypothetical protein
MLKKPMISQHYPESPPQQLKRHISTLSADYPDLSALTILHAEKWLESLGSIVAANQFQWIDPLIQITALNEVVFEWWCRDKKLTIYIEDTNAEYVQVWGPDIDHEMIDGDANRLTDIERLWKWLVG